MVKRLSAIVLLLSTTACTSLQPVVQPSAFFAQKNPKYVVVTTTGSDDSDDPLVLDMPKLQNGSLTGFYQGDPMTVSMTQVRVLRATQPDRRRTTFAIVGGAVILGGIGYLISNQGKAIDNTCRPPDCGNFPHVR